MLLMVCPAAFRQCIPRFVLESSLFTPTPWYALPLSPSLRSTPPSRRATWPARSAELPASWRRLRQHPPRSGPQATPDRSRRRLGNFRPHDRNVRPITLAQRGGIGNDNYLMSDRCEERVTVLADKRSARGSLAANDNRKHQRRNAVERIIYQICAGAEPFLLSAAPTLTLEPLSNKKGVGTYGRNFSNYHPTPERARPFRGCPA
jgi:hypothetical protein